MVNADPLMGLYEDEDSNDPLEGMYEDDVEEKPKKKKRSFEERLAAGGEEAPSAGEIFQYSLTPATSFISGATLGASEHIPGMKPHPERSGMKFAGEAAGSIAPISALHKAISIPFKGIAAGAPILKKPAQIASNWLATGVTGAAYEGSKEAIKGNVPTMDDVLEHGALWMAIDASLGLAGKGARFAKGLFTKGEELGKHSSEILKKLTQQMEREGVAFNNDIGDKALEILESPNFMKKGEVGRALEVKDITNEQIDALANKSLELPNVERPKVADFTKATQDLSEATIESQLDNFHPKAEDSAQLGEQIQQDIANNLKGEEELYRPKYEEVERVAADSYINASNTRSVARRALSRIEKLKTKPAGYANVEKALNDVLDDVRGTISEATGKSTIETQGSKLIELGRRLNQIVQYDILEKGIKDLLKPVKDAVKSDARKAISHDKNALKLFNEAEKEFGDVAKRYGADSIYGIRGEKAHESIADKLTKPSTLKELRNILDPMQMRQVERQVLDNLNSLSHPKAIKELKEIRRQLSKNAQKIADDLIAMKSPFGSLTQRATLRDNIRKDIAKNIQSGEQPKATIDMWYSKEGQKLVIEATQGLPNQKELLKYFSDQSVNNAFDSIITPEGKIDFKKFKDMFRDPNVINDIHRIGGDDAVNFFKNIEKMSKQLERNLSLIEKIPKEMKPTARGKEKIERTGQTITDRLVREEEHQYPLFTKLDKVLDNFKPEMKVALNVLGVVTHAPTWGALVGGKMILNRMVRSGGLRKAIRSASQPRASWNSVYTALAALEKALDQEETDPEQRKQTRLIK